jgi:hypothetical protein
MFPQSPERCKADPMMVEQLIAAIGKAMHKAVVQDVTTTSDIISAFFTILDRLLREARKLQSEEDQFYNSQEISHILTAMLFEFGSCGETKH